MTLSRSTCEPVPLEWVQKLFDRMAIMYGSRVVADFWVGLDLAEVKAAWAVELGKLTPEQLGAGVRTMGNAFAKRPPSLPELMAHCRAARPHVTDAPQLTDQTRADPETQRSGMERFREAVRPLAMPRNPGSAWAHRLLERGTSRSGGALPAEVRRVAEGAIANHARRGKHGDE